MTKQNVTQTEKQGLLNKKSFWIEFGFLTAAFIFGVLIATLFQHYAFNDTEQQSSAKFAEGWIYGYAAGVRDTQAKCLEAFERYDAQIQEAWEAYDAEVVAKCPDMIEKP